MRSADRAAIARTLSRFIGGGGSIRSDETGRCRPPADQRA